MFKKFLSLFAALTLSVGLWAQSVGDKFVDETSGLKFKITAVGETNTVKVIANNYSGTSYTVPATVSYQSVTFNVTEIGYEAFYNCSKLNSITIPNSVTTIGDGAFECCESLQSVTLSEGLITIGELAFALTGLTSITIPAGVTEIGMGAFYECTGLASVTFSGNACQNAIGEDAFYNVGNPDPALLTLHGTWAKENQPDEDGNWYGGKFELSEDPTALPSLPYEGKVGKGSFKFMHNGQLIIRKGNKAYNAVGTEL